MTLSWRLGRCVVSLYPLAERMCWWAGRDLFTLDWLIVLGCISVRVEMRKHEA